jgi:succinate dehydrogenase / fumarate reductase, cytochrome b subunit
VSSRTISDRYRAGAGMLAWILHRISGLALAGYLVIHIWDVSAAYRGGAQSFSEVMATFDTPFWKIMDTLLVAAVVFHTLNGIRILLFDKGIGLRFQRPLFWISFVITLAIFIMVFIKTAQHF